MKHADTKVVKTRAEWTEIAIREHQPYIEKLENRIKKDQDGN